MPWPPSFFHVQVAGRVLFRRARSARGDEATNLPLCRRWWKAIGVKHAITGVRTCSREEIVIAWTAIDGLCIGANPFLSGKQIRRAAKASSICLLHCSAISGRRRWCGIEARRMTLCIKCGRRPGGLFGIVDAGQAGWGPPVMKPNGVSDGAYGVIAELLGFSLPNKGVTHVQKCSLFTLTARVCSSRS